MDLDPAVWGPHFWFFLHTLSVCYPVRPTKSIKKKSYDFIMNLPIFIPNHGIGNKIAHLIDDFPVTPYLDSRLSFMKWVHFMHNKINANLHKEEIGFRKGLELYYSAYRQIPQHVKNKQNKNTTYTTVIVIICVLIISIYNK